MQPETKSKRWSRRSGAGGTIFTPAVYPRTISTTSTQHFYQSVFSSKNRLKNDGVCRSENSSPRFVFEQSASSLLTKKSRAHREIPLQELRASASRRTSTLRDHCAARDHSIRRSQPGFASTSNTKMKAAALALEP